MEANYVHKEKLDKYENPEDMTLIEQFMRETLKEMKKDK